VSVERRVVGGKVRYLARWRDGNRSRSRTFDRKGDAEDFERDQRRRAQLGAHTPVAPSRELLEEWLRRWWSLEASTWARSTRLQRGGVMDRWITPSIGSVRLRDLGPARVREWRGAILEEGCPPTQANAALSVLSAALGAAVRDGLLPANPCHGLRRVPAHVARPRALSPHEVERLRAAMPTVRDVVMVGLLAYAGLRPGEALALTWGSVGQFLVVDSAVSAGELRRRTKTGSRRTVEAITPLAEDLALLRPARPDPDALVIAGPRGGVLDLHNWRARVWREACDRAGVKATPYDGRHTYASLLIHEGRSVPFVATALGHASGRMTLAHYAHVFDEAHLEPAVSMVEAVTQARAKLRRRGVYPVCTERAPRVLRSPRRARKSPA
jgi:integrase